MAMEEWGPLRNWYLDICVCFCTVIPHFHDKHWKMRMICYFRVDFVVAKIKIIIINFRSLKCS